MHQGAVPVRSSSIAEEVSTYRPLVDGFRSMVDRWPQLRQQAERELSVDGTFDPGLTFASGWGELEAEVLTAALELVEMYR